MLRPPVLGLRRHVVGREHPEHVQETSADGRIAEVPAEGGTQVGGLRRFVNEQVSPERRFLSLYVVPVGLIEGGDDNSENLQQGRPLRFVTLSRDRRDGQFPSRVCSLTPLAQAAKGGKSTVDRVLVGGDDDGH